MKDVRYYFPSCGNRFLSDSAEIKNFMNESELPMPSTVVDLPFFLVSLLTFGILLASIYLSPFSHALQFSFDIPGDRSERWRCRILFSSFCSFELPLLDLSFSTLSCPFYSVSLPLFVCHSLFFGAALSHNRPDDSAVHQNGMAC